jgi:hypothetical protein
MKHKIVMFSQTINPASSSSEHIIVTGAGIIYLSCSLPYSAVCGVPSSCTQHNNTKPRAPGAHV